MVERVIDLKRPLLRTQMKTDVEGGVRVMLCPFDTVKEGLKEPDFGIWDSEYVCFVHYYPTRAMEEIILDGRPDVIKLAQDQEKLVRKYAVNVIDVDLDLDKYIKEHGSYVKQ